MGQGQFHVSGFGQNSWPVQIDYDLAVLLEQIPTVATAVKSGIPSEIDFFGQGIERILHIQPSGDNCEISCLSYGNWTPLPTVEVLSKASLLQMLFAVQNEFLRALSTAAPELAKSEFIVEWMHQDR
jgi:hypothetical protein